MNIEDEIKKEFHEKFLELRKIINSYELMPGSGKNAFNKLIWQVLSHLYRGTEVQKISRILESELISRYGLSIKPNETEEIAIDILRWWDSVDRIIY